MLHVCDILESLEATAGRLDKEDTMRRHRGNDSLRRIFVAAADPYTDYGVRKLKAPPPPDTRHPDEDLFMGFVDVLLPRLAARELTGNAARDAVVESLARMSEVERKWASRVLLKNLRCGVSEAIIEKTWPGAIRKFSVALAESADAKFVDDRLLISGVTYPVAVEPKLDGLRLIAIKSSGSVRLFTRNGTEIFTLKRIKDSLEALPLDDIVFDGEAFSPAGGWNESASIMMSAKKMKDDAAINYYIFDTVPLPEWEQQASSMPLAARSAFLRGTVLPLLSHHPNLRLVDSVVASSPEDILGFYTKSLDEGYEGVMIKDLTARYIFKRSSAILKMKPVATAEGAIVACYDGNMGTKREGLFGGFEVVLPNGVVTRVGSGLTDAIRSEVQLSGPDSYIGRIIELSYQPPLTEDGKARFPVFERFRSPEDVDPAILEASQKFLEGKLKGD